MATSKTKKSAKAKVSPLETVTAMSNEFMELQANASKFIEGGTKAACARARKNAMNIKRLCGQLRVELQTVKSSM